ncbi:MAG: bifunctional oligoribonuclease/PAP phosphatase NrnA [Thermoguttaceae bacterium]|nr:bifunctional oligoribonuclease/PAP phosphatase NrnA [Thermoguttaceae bacterium]MDW8039422.1 bifunctional oligoribonuclease/PAP phosphatase NrnA [Thermoguttaceae bacterium]
MPASSSSCQKSAVSAGSINWSRLIARLQQAQQIVVVTHVRPDCDALGSSLALANFLERMGKQVCLVGPFDMPPSFRFLDPEGRFRRLGRDVQPEQLEQADLVIIVDTSAWAQLGDAAEWIRSTKVPKIVLDHHRSSEDLGAEEFKDPTAEATGRLVYELACRLGISVDPMSAVQLFAAVATDTGWFRFGSTRADTYRLAAALTDAGAAPDQLYQQLYENDSLGRLRLTGRVLCRAEAALGGRLIYSWIERSDFEATGALPSDTEDLVNFLMGVAGAEVALMFIELATGGLKVSFRSKAHWDCSQLAGLFGGGGHRQAAGAFLTDPLPIVRQKVLEAVQAAMQ